MQNHYNLIYREEEREMLPLCREEGIGVIPWSPLARGFLAGNRQGGTVRGQTDSLGHRFYHSPEDHLIADRTGEVAARHGVSPAQVALAWLLDQPGVTAPIVGATKPHHLTEAVAALRLHLSTEDRAYLEEPYRPRAVLGI